MPELKAPKSALSYAPYFVGDDGPMALDARFGDSPIIITAPHAGWLVPSVMYRDGKPLGLEHHMFDPTNPARRHEACDWGTAELMSELAEEGTLMEASMMVANYSRLVVDLNRTPEVWLTTKLDELGSPVPSNQGITENNADWRINNFYNPWFSTLNYLIGKAKERHGFAVVLDIHSFTPVFNGVQRDVDIGSISLTDTPRNLRIDATVRRRALEIGLDYKPNAPYNVRANPYTRRRFATEIISGTFNATYHGLEIRNNLLATPKGHKEIAKIITNSIEDVLENPPLEHEPSV